MASFDASQFEGFEDLRTAMTVVVDDLKAPVNWNEWQQIVAAVRVHYPSENQNRTELAEMRRSVLEERFVAVWQQQLTRPLERRVRMSGAAADGAPVPGVPAVADAGEGDRDTGAGVGTLLDAIEDGGTRPEGGTSRVASTPAGTTFGEAVPPPPPLPEGVALVREMYSNRYTAAFEEHGGGEGSETSSQAGARVQNLCGALSDAGGTRELLNAA